MPTIYKILAAAEWAAATAAGAFKGAAIDLSDGYIHFSAADQVAETARKWFQGRDDLVLVAVRAEDLGAALKWEVSRGGAPFPHLYAELPTRLAVSARPLQRDPQGEFVFGDLDP